MTQQQFDAIETSLSAAYKKADRDADALATQHGWNDPRARAARNKALRLFLVYNHQIQPYEQAHFWAIVVEKMRGARKESIAKTLEFIIECGKKEEREDLKNIYRHAYKQIKAL